MKMNVTTHYPYSEQYAYETILEILNLDREKIKDVSSGNGFVISSPKPIRDSFKDDYGIFSTKYGQTLQDKSPFGTRYRCKCGYLTMRFNDGQICPICKTRVEFVDDKFTYFGWITLKDPYHIIHPNLYSAIASLIGPTAFDSIISPNEKRDEDGNEVIPVRGKDEPFKNLGLMEFYDRFDEVIDFYVNKRPDKKDYYDLIKENREKVFIQSIPVYTIHLRPYKLEQGELHYEGTNALYNIISHLAARINNDRYKINKKNKPKLQLMYDLQKKYMELDEEINKIISGKKGSVRALFGGRFNYTGRSVIAPDNSLRSDQVKLSYHMLCGLMQQTIINILHRSYNMMYNEAYKYLYENMSRPNSRIVTIIEGLINSRDGVHVIINRNPTIELGSIISMQCVGIEFNYTMSVPLNVLKALGADLIRSASLFDWCRCG